MRGDVWTGAGRGDFEGKPRPVVVLQDDRFDLTDSITVCPLTSTYDEIPLFRPLIQPTPENGLHAPSRIMADKVTTLRRSRLTSHIGRLSDEDMIRVNRAVVVFLGLAGA